MSHDRLDTSRHDHLPLSRRFSVAPMMDWTDMISFILYFKYLKINSLQVKQNLSIH
jgi:tRNA-dihydrouridine synthase